MHIEISDAEDDKDSPKSPRPPSVINPSSVNFQPIFTRLIGTILFHHIIIIIIIMVLVLHCFCHVNLLVFSALKGNAGLEKNVSEMKSLYKLCI